MKFTGKVTYRGFDNGQAWGTYKEVELTLSNPAAGTSFRNVTKSDLDSLIEDLNRIKEELENAPVKNTWA